MPLLFIHFLLSLSLSVTFSSECLSSFDKLIEISLREQSSPISDELKTEVGQSIKLPLNNFIKTSSDRLISSIDMVNDLYKDSNWIELPSSLLVSCPLNGQNSCFFYHHILLSPDLMDNGSMLSEVEKKAVIFHEYAHSVFKKNIFKEKKSWLRSSKYQVLSSYYYEKKIRNEGLGISNLKDAGRYNEYRLKYLMLEEEQLRRDVVFVGIDELHADTISVLLSGDPSIIERIVKSHYEVELRKVNRDMSSLSSKQAAKIQARDYSYIDNLINYDNLESAHAIFSPTRQIIYNKYIKGITEDKKGQFAQLLLVGLRNSIKNIEEKYILEYKELSKLIKTPSLNGEFEAVRQRTLIIMFNEVVQKDLELVMRNL